MTSSKPEPKSDFEVTSRLAQKAMEYAQKFNTAPTPEVYEVWFRYAEGKHEAIVAHLTHSIEELNSVTEEQLNDLHKQYCRPAIDQVSRELSGRLESEMEGLQAVIQKQIAAGDEFHDSIDQASGELSAVDIAQGPDAFAGGVANCVANLLKSSKKMQTELSEAREQLEDSQTVIQQLKQDLAASQEVMMTDPLTHCGNRRRFDTAMHEAIESRDSGAKRKVALILVDLDNLKELNDSYGHAIGDSILRFVATTIKRSCPEGTVARYGGDEFGVFVPVETQDEASKKANEICKALRSKRLKHRETGILIECVTGSIGVSVLQEVDTADSWFDRADKSLYHAKQDGRNCVRCDQQAVGV